MRWALDRAKVKRALEQHTHRAAIQADLRLGAEVEAEGAPQTFINGRRIVGAQPAGAFRALIQAELDHAAAMVKAGTAPAAVYETILAEGKTGTKPASKTIDLPAPLAKLPVRGPANAKVSIVEFADFQCSYCIRAEATVRTLVDEHAGNVQLVWINRPLEMHPQAELSAEAAEEAFRQRGNAGFWPLHDALFAHGHEESGLTLDAILGYATAQKLDADKMRAALTPVDNAKAAHRATADRDGKVAEAAGFNGTPHVRHRRTGGKEGAGKLSRESEVDRLRRRWRAGAGCISPRDRPRAARRDRHRRREVGFAAARPFAAYSARGEHVWYSRGRASRASPSSGDRRPRLRGDCGRLADG